MELMNSQGYWDNRFRTGDWEKCGGEEQSTFFAEVAVQAFPEWFVAELNENEWEFKDYGCALGDGTAYIAQRFPSCAVTGIDISEEAVRIASEKYPYCGFLVGDMADHIDEADIIFSSNTLEHMKSPKKLLKEMVQKARKYAVLLVPFEDSMGIEEHFHIFTSSFFPASIGNHALCCMRIIDYRNTEKGKLYWNGKQALVIYVNHAYKHLENNVIADFYHSNVFALQEERLSLIRQMAQKDEAIEQEQKEKSMLRDQLAQKDALLSLEQAAKTMLKDQAAEREHQLASSQADRDALVGQLARSEEEKKALVDQVARQESAIMRSEDEKRKLTEELTHELDMALRTSEALAQEKENALHTSEERVQAYEKQLRACEALAQEKENALRASEERVQAYEKQLRALETLAQEKAGALRESQERALEHEKKLHTCDAKAREYEKRVRSSEALVREKEQALRASAKLVREKEDQLASITARIDSYEKESADAKAALEAQSSQLASIQTCISQMKAEAASLEYWLSLTGRSVPLKLGHLMVQVKHALIGTPEEKAECRRWLKGDRSFVPKFSYVRQCMVRAAELNAHICAVAGPASQGMPEQASAGLNGYEYKYLRFQNKRNKHFQLDFSRLAVTQEKGKVSVVLPVYNGDDMIEESIKSVLAQTYRNFELIIVDDGSTDKTPKIVDRWAKKDKRIRVIHQANAKLPRALNNGFCQARGEFLTWTSADNRMHHDFLEKLVDFMQRHPQLAMCYANLRAIDAKGEPMKDSTWYSSGDRTGNVYLPHAELRLNTYPDNTVAAAFMYRRAVPDLLGGYDPQLYTVEDYDYWMRINDFCSLKHTDFENAIYDYRFHEKSLTAKAKELRINEMRDKLMLMEDYRQDWIIRPMCWVLEEDADSIWREMANAAGDISLTRKEAKRFVWPRLGTGVAQITFAENGEAARQEECVTQDTIRVLIRKGDVCEEDGKRFDLLVQLGDSLSNVPEGWIRAVDEKTAFDIVAVFCKARWFNQMIEANRTDTQAKKKATIVLCTYKRTDIAQQALTAMASQTMNKDTYEILVVNNDPESTKMRQIVSRLQKQNKGKDFYRYIDCPYPGLSAARNFSLYAARGEIMLYVDDDGIMDRNCLLRIVKAFEKHEDAGVIGGQILLKDPERFKDVILDGYEGVWSERKFSQKGYFEAEFDWDFPYGCNYAVRRTTLRELGGFRVSYGRVGKDFSGGEEMVLSHLVKRSGMKVGIEPGAIVIHDVEPSRYSLEHVRKTIRASRLTNRLMKMDLYKPYDIGMHEEYEALGVVQDKLNQLSNAGVGEADLRQVYSRAELEAVREAISAGEEDIRIMRGYSPTA